LIAAAFHHYQNDSEWAFMPHSAAGYEATQERVDVRKAWYLQQVRKRLLPFEISQT
jgi:hypothetical protein